MALPEVTATLDADVSGFVAAWDRAADAAERAAARIRAAQASIGDIKVDTDGLRGVGAELDKVGESARNAGAEWDESAKRWRDASGQFVAGAKSASESMSGFGRSGSMAARMLGPLGAAVAAAAALLPAVAAAGLAAGAALQGLGVAALVVAGGWRGLEQAGERLKASLGGLQKQLESIFRSELSQEFTKLGQAISGLDGPIKGIAHSVSDVIKEFTGWIRSAAGLEEINQMLGGVDNMVKQLAPGAKALAQAFTAFGAAAAPAMDEVGKALSSVFVELNKVIQEAKKSGQLEKAFQAGAKAIEAFGKLAAGVLAVLIELAAEGGEPAAASIGKLGDALKENAPQIAKMVAEISRTVDNIMSLIQGFNQAKAATGGFGDAVMKLSTDIAKGLAIGDWTSFFNTIKKGFPDAGKSVSKFGTDAKKALDKFKDDTNKNINKTLEDTKKAIDKWKDDTNKSINKWVEDWKKGVDKWKDDTNKNINKGLEDAKKAIDKWKDDTNESINEFVSEWLEAVAKWWEDTSKNIQEGVDKAVEFISTLPDKAMQALSGWVKDMKQIGKDAIDGIAEGIESAVGNLVGAATKAAKAALAAIKGTLGIRSPSAVFREEVGMMISAGIAEGIIANAGRVTDAVNRTGLGALVATGGASGGGMSVGRGGSQTLTIQVLGGADSAAGTFIARLAQQGKLKITANAVVGGRR